MTVAVSIVSDRSSTNSHLESHGYKRQAVTGGDFDEEPF